MTDEHQLKPRPFKFGDPVINIHAAEGNPGKRGFFVRRDFSSNRVNGGWFNEYTDGNGRFAKIPDDGSLVLDKTRTSLAAAEARGGLSYEILNYRLVLKQAADILRDYGCENVAKQIENLLKHYPDSSDKEKE